MHSLHGLSPSAPAYINKAFVLVIVAASLVVNSSGVLLPSDLGDGTTPNLKAIFLGRCYDCEYCSEEQAGLYNCSGLWDAFSSSFSYQEPCNSVPEDFDDFVSMAFVPLADNQTLFYSGMYSIAMAIGRQSSDFTNIELTMLGGLVDGMTFCGMVDAPGINYDACPTFGSCENDVDALWKESSQYFAGQASGEVTVILDGSRADGAYRPKSFFRPQEVANLDPAKVTSLTAYVVHSLNGDVTEKCVTGSLLQLQEDVATKGIKFECIDDPSITRHVQCIQDPGHETCRP
ncbi:ADP-ribosyl cyclase/cyclic ADP-ribose hydrolase 2-like [Strongylocentrotus purpuratus]|uniref:ADP-ribosyl cyclase/cyclic ADP-ribose hydrolase n=1 Tax=Strongylocentrotus purpuratus TaxID=7668 RepID=A0A7M7NLY1_STRPU|nr:ADP-ribosyl cyclase/cyclic ADP-ribose hydrolase 2-like [Strongylocentrotus purpuratus]